MADTRNRGTGTGFAAEERAAMKERGKVVCFFQDSNKFKTRYATLGFSDEAALDDGTMWPNSYALTEITPEVVTRISDLLTRAVS